MFPSSINSNPFICTSPVHSPVPLVPRDLGKNYHQNKKMQDLFKESMDKTYCLFSLSNKLQHKSTILQYLQRQVKNIHISKHAYYPCTSNKTSANKMRGHKRQNIRLFEKRCRGIVFHWVQFPCLFAQSKQSSSLCVFAELHSSLFKPHSKSWLQNSRASRARES